MAINRYRLADKADKNNKRAQTLQRLLAEPDRLLGTILLGNNLVNNAAVAITTMLAWKYYGEAGVGIATILITILILVVAEVPPKTVAATYPERIAFFAAYVLEFLKKVFHPIVVLLSLVTRLIRYLPGFKSDSSSQALNVDELRIALQASKHHYAPQQMDLLLGILELGMKSIASIMVPRSEIHAIDLNDDISDIVDEIRRENFARMLVYDKSFDNILGELDIRELLQAGYAQEVTKQMILDNLKEPIYLFEDSLVLEQIQHLQLENRNLGIIVDEYGTVVGLITLNEMMEEMAGIVGGQIPGVHPGIIAEKGQDGYLVNAKLNIRDLNRMMQWKLPEDGPNTVNGQILEKNEDIPAIGTAFKFGDYTVETVRVKASGVEIVRIIPLTSAIEAKKRDGKNEESFDLSAAGGKAQP